MQQTKPRFGHLLRPPAWKQSGTLLVEREGMDKRRKQVKRMRKEKVKNANDEEANGQGREKGEKGYLNPMRDKNS